MVVYRYIVHVLQYKSKSVTAHFCITFCMKYTKQANILWFIFKTLANVLMAMKLWRNYNRLADGPMDTFFQPCHIRSRLWIQKVLVRVKWLLMKCNGEHSHWHYSTCSTSTQCKCTYTVYDSWPHHAMTTVHNVLISSRILYRGTCTSKRISTLTLCFSINIPTTPLQSLLVWTPPLPPSPSEFPVTFPVGYRYFLEAHTACTHIIMVFFGYTNLPICILSQCINGIFFTSSTFRPMKLYLMMQRDFLVIRTILSFSWSQWSILWIKYFS